MKLDSIFKLDIICLLFSTTTSIPLNENTNDVNSNTVNDNNILESSLYLNNNNDIDNNEMSSAIWIDDDSIDEITNSHLSNSYIPENYITGTFELKSTATTVINPIITESSTIPTITSAKETNNSEIAISDNTQDKNEIIPTKVSEAIVLDEALPTNLVIETETETETETEIESEIEAKLEYELEDELEDEIRISEIESNIEIEIDDIETETEYETETSFIPIPEIVALPSSNKYIFNKLPSDNDKVQDDTINKSNLQSNVIDTDSLSPTDNNPNNGYDTEDTKEEDEDENEKTDDYKHIISSHNSQYTNNNMKKLSNKNRFSQVNSSNHKSKKKNGHKNNKEHNHNNHKDDNKNQSSNHKYSHNSKFKHNPFSKNKHKEDDEVNTTLTTTSTTEKDNITTLRTKTKTKADKDNITSLRTKTISKPQRVNKSSQTVETPIVVSPRPSTTLSTPTVSVLHNNVVSAVCWTLPNKPCCNSCNTYKSYNYTSSIVKYYGKENDELCGISDLCIVDEQDKTPNKKTVIDSKGNEIQKKVVSDSNQNVKKPKKNEEDAIIKIPICWSHSLPCCEDCTIVTSSNESQNQYLGWENDNWCAIRDSCLRHQRVKSNENVTPNKNLDTGLMIKETADSEKEYKYINTNCWSYPFYSCCDDCASAQVLSDPENNNYLGWEKDNWCGIPEDCF